MADEIDITVKCTQSCGDTTLEQHPRIKEILRCSNCKEWLLSQDNEIWLRVNRDD